MLLCKIQGLLNEFLTVLKDYECMKNADFDLKIQLAYD